MWITFLDRARHREYTNNMNIQTIYFSKICKIGDSHGIVIPVEILRGLNWQRGELIAFGFAGTEQIFLKRLSDVEILKMKPAPDVQVS